MFQTKKKKDQRRYTYCYAWLYSSHVRQYSHQQFLLFFSSVLYKELLVNNSNIYILLFAPLKKKKQNSLWSA